MLQTISLSTDHLARSEWAPNNGSVPSMIERPPTEATKAFAESGFSHGMTVGQGLIPDCKTEIG